jgi:hypothetical protein
MGDSVMAMEGTSALLVKDVEFELPWGGKIIGKAGLTIRVCPTEHIALIDAYHVQLEPDEYQVL